MSFSFYLNVYVYNVVVEFEKRKPVTMLIKNTKVEDKNPACRDRFLYLAFVLLLR